MKRSPVIVVKSISLILLLGLVACTSESHNERQLEVTSVQQSEDVNISVHDKETEKTSEVMLWKQENVETQMKLTKKEALDLVFEHYTDLTDKMVELSFYETEDGRIGYQWSWENIERRPMFLEETHSFVDSQGEIYLFFEVYSDLCDLKGDYYRTEIFQNYAINMVNGQIIEERVYNELDMWEYSDDFTALFGYEK